MESEEPDKRYKPIFNEGDRVIFLRSGYRVAATVKVVSLPPVMDEVIDKMKARYGEEEIGGVIASYLERDPHCLDNPIYGIIPDGFSEPATWEVASLICPALTRQQYDRIMGWHGRYFVALESDIIPEEWDT